ncbi:MAG: CCA tRNA nucleotidyltransferase [Clostridia bacterium]|nr:CCA tRNA nucleotidyltransferase [Clostridia bacterium]
MKIPDHILKVLNVLENNGFEGYLVGGCVRDAKMGIEPHDFDLTTNATPDEMLDIFSDYRIIETGLKHGTVTVVSDGENVEITTYRIDGEYLDNRRPEEVFFTRNLKEDLSRRDFTVNAFAYSPSKGFVDMFGGEDDLENKTIRCVGEADKRFNEDGLRIMRALRFASCLGFSIEKATSESILKNCHLLKNISVERIYSEFKRLVCGVDAGKIIKEYTDVFSVANERIKSCSDVVAVNSEKIHKIKTGYLARIASLFYGSEKGLARRFMKDMKADNYAADFISELHNLSGCEVNADKVSVRRLMRDYDDEFILSLGDLKRAFDSGFDYDAFMSEYNVQKELNPCVRLKQLKVTGQDIISFGIEKGPKIGEIMNETLNAVIEDRCNNDYDSIKRFVTELNV